MPLLLNPLFNEFDFMFRNLKVTDDYFHPVRDHKISYPIIDQRYNDDELQLIIAATGAVKEDFKIKLDDDVLYISRQHKEPDLTKFKYIKNNISRKAFDVAFKVPKVWDVELLTVVLENGELIITIPMKPESKPKQIEFDIK